MQIDFPDTTRSPQLAVAYLPSPKQPKPLAAPGNHRLRFHLTRADRQPLQNRDNGPKEIGPQRSASAASTSAARRGGDGEERAPRSEERHECEGVPRHCQNGPYIEVGVKLRMRLNSQCINQIRILGNDRFPPTACHLRHRSSAWQHFSRRIAILYSLDAHCRIAFRRWPQMAGRINDARRCFDSRVA
jgi:hypothetical protein